jgi:HrpA-like RNA helicase
MPPLSIRSDGILDPEGKYPNPVNFGLPYSNIYRKLAKSSDPKDKGWSQLKAYEDRFEILKKIHDKSILLVSLPTGTGKTVIVPRLLYHYFGYEQKIIVTTPRQQTTSGAGEYAALCFDVPLFHVGPDGKYIKNPEIEKGKENRYPTGNKIVSYKHSANKELYDNNLTKLLFTTDGTVKTMITSGDQDLKDYGGIVIDEVHERSVNIDIVIALVMDILNRRKDFKVIFMSATVNLDIFTNYFKRLGHGDNYNIYTVKEQKTTYDIKYIKEEKPLVKNANKLIDQVYNKIHERMLELETTKEIGDILAFVSSDSETIKLKLKINKNIANYSEDNRPYVIAMSSKTSEDEMNNAKNAGSLKTIKPTKDAPKGYKRKIIIATPMAESSITFSDPLTYVIDSGISYSKHYDADKYCYVAGKKYVTQASIKQRCGRTGRTCAGTCIQLYTDNEFKDFKEYTIPEILSEDFTNDMLNILKLPVTQQNIVKSIIFIKNMIEPISNYDSFLKVGIKNLKEMDFIDNNGNLTELGDICSEFNTYDIKIAKMIIGGFFLNCIEWTIMLGAIIHTISSFSDIFKSLTEEDKKHPEKKQNYENNIKKFVRPEGDHISLLIIYYNFRNNQSSQEYADKNGLDYKILTQIQKAHDELYTLIIQANIKTRFAMLDRFQNINQFTNYPGYMYKGVGGGNTKKNKSKKDKQHKKEKQHKKTQKNKINIKYKKHNNASRTYYKKNIHNHKSNVNLFNGNNKNDRRLNFRNDSIIESNLDLGLTMKGGESTDKYTKRRIKYMDLFTLSQFQLRKKSIKLSKNVDINDIFTRIIASLYYGYSTNIACYSGSGNDYNVKFSSIKGKMTGALSKTSFDYIYPKTDPDWIIYNTFVVAQDFGKLESSGNLNLITILEQKHLNYFFPLKEFHKQIITEIP